MKAAREQSGRPEQTTDDVPIAKNGPAVAASAALAELLEQGSLLVGSLADEVYDASCDDGRWSSVGAHLRHVIDYLDCLLSGSDGGVVDYTIRRRCRDVEHQRSAGLRELARCIEMLQKLGADRDHESVDVRCDEAEPWVVSTLGRELRFVASHTVHHFALIGLCLARHGIETPRHFGVSPSTLAHRARSA